MKRGAELSTVHHLDETLAKQEMQQVVCDLPDQMGGFGEQRSKDTVCIQNII